MSARGLAGPAFGGRGFPGRSLTGRSFVDHGLRGPHGIAGNVGRFADHGGRNALAAHNQLGGAGHGQFAHNQLAHNQFAGQHLHALNNFHTAHNEFAAKHFHGLNNFNHTGFNRNAFGDRHGWNRWGGRFWGAGWNQWGGGWGGWAGPVFWPFLYGDIFSFALWPYSYYDPFWAVGPAFVLASIFAPGPYFGLDYGYAPGYYGYTYGSDYYGYEPYPNGSVPNVYYGRNGGSDSGDYAGVQSYTGGRQQATKAIEANRQALVETNTEAVQSCGGLAPGVTNLPIDKIRQAIHPSSDQEAALDDLNTASSQANDIVKSSCPTELPLTPVGRLDAAERRIETMIQADREVLRFAERRAKAAVRGDWQGARRGQFRNTGR